MVPALLFAGVPVVVGGLAGSVIEHSVTGATPLEAAAVLMEQNFLVVSVHLGVQTAQFILTASQTASSDVFSHAQLAVAESNFKVALQAVHG